MALCFGEQNLVNRAAILLRYKEPFVQWINDADPSDDDAGATLGSANKDKSIYLITNTDAENYEIWIELNYKDLFKSELGDWYTDETLWPKNITKKIFDEWFEVECHSVLIDTVGGEIYVDET